MKPILSLCLLAALCSGCVSTYNTNSVSRSAALRKDATALVALPEDGRFENIPYPGSGRKTALAVSAAFAKHLRRVDITAETAPLARSLEQAKAGRFDYLVVPTIVHWEDRTTEWSGRPDRIEIELRTVDAPSGETLALGSVKGKSKWATFGGDVPEDLLADPIGNYVEWLFSPMGTPLPEAKAEKPKPSVQSGKPTSY